MGRRIHDDEKMKIGDREQGISKDFSVAALLRNDKINYEHPLCKGG
jgi:hypothetical protein